MYLSSLRRLRLYCAGESEEPISNTTKNNRQLSIWLASASKQIENYLGREIEITERTEYFDADYAVMEYWPMAYPVIDLVSVDEDSSALWDGSESEITDSVIGTKNNSIVLGTTLEYTGKKAIRVIYSGGLAYHPVQSIFAITTIKSWTAGKYVVGGTSGAVGIVVSSSSYYLTVENYYGVFEKGETLTEYTGEGTSPTGISGVIASIQKQSLAESNSDLVTACEAQIRYQWRHMTDFENAGTDKEGMTIRRTHQETRKYPFIDEVLDLLEPYRRIW
jgi:hypothetical protein